MKIRTLRQGFFFPALACAMLACAALPACQSSGAKPKPISQVSKEEQDFEQAVNRAPTATTLYAMARIFAAQHRDTDCQNILNKIIAEHPDYMPAYNDLAEVQMRQRHIDDAIATLNIALKTAPRQAIFLNNLGMCYLLKGEYEPALGYYTRAAGADPNDSRYRANMATALGMQGRYDEAFQLYCQIGAVADAHYNLAVLAEARKDQPRADQEFGLAKSLAASSKEPKAKAATPD